MANDVKTTPKWTLITIDDPACLPGKSIFDAIQLILKAIDLRYVILYDIEGSGKDWLVFTLQKKENTVMKIDDLLKELPDVKQFDWGDFFLCKEYPKNWNNSEDVIYYPDVIIQSDTTVRAVDDQYIYIYTPYQEIVDIIKANYEIESITTDYLENLSYPY